MFEKGVVLCESVKDGIMTEKLLLKHGFSAKKIAPPIKYRKGCEISVEVDLCKKDEIIPLLDSHGVNHKGIVPLQ